MRRVLLSVSLLALTAASNEAAAKDLRSRVGLGFDAQLGQVTTVTARYGLPTPNPAINVQVQGAFGIDSYTGSPSRIFGGGKLLYGVVAEDNLNLYGTVGAGVLSTTTAATGTELTIRTQPGLAVDFFPFGLDNLGFTASWGLNLDAGASPGVRTTGSVGAGVHYWF